MIIVPILVHMPDPKTKKMKISCILCSSPYISRWYDLISEYEVQVEWYIVSSIEADSYSKGIAYQLQPVWVPVEWVPGEWYIVSSIETDSYSKGIAYQLQSVPARMSSSEGYIVSSKRLIPTVRESRTNSSQVKTTTTIRQG